MSREPGIAFAHHVPYPLWPSATPGGGNGAVDMGRQLGFVAFGGGYSPAMSYHLLHPASVGGFGCRTTMDWSVEPPRVRRLHVELDSWFGGAVTEVFPCYVVTDLAAAKLTGANLSGFDVRELEVTLAKDSFELMGHGLELPSFHWLFVTGEAGRDDIGLTVMSGLVVSDRAFDGLARCGLSDCGHEIYAD